MGKKPVVVQDAKKKKKSGCGTVLLAVFLVFVLLLGIGTGVGYFFLDKYTKANLDMPLYKCLGVVNSLYWASDKKMVDNGFDAGDYDKFETEFKHQLFLKDDVELDLLEAVKLLTEEESSQDPNAVQIALLEAASGDEETTSSDNKLFDFISSFMTRENIDYDRLAAYNKDAHDDYVFHLNDRQLAAFLDRVIDAYAADSEEMRDLFEQTGMEKLSQAIALRQIKFVRENRVVLDENGDAGESKQVTVAKLTVQIKLTDISKAVFKKNIPNGFLAGLAQFAVRTVLPNNVYITVGVGLTDNIGLDLSINRLSGEKMENAYKLIDGIARLVGDDGDQATSTEATGIKEQINQTVTESLSPTLQSINEVADFSQIDDGTLYFDTYGAMANMVVEGNADSDDPLTGRDVLFAFSRVATSDPVAVEKTHDYRNWYERTDGSKVYITDSAQVTDDLTAIDYGQKFVDELKEKYLLDDKADGTPYTLSEIVDAFMGEGDTEFVDMLDVKKLGALSAGKTEEELRLALTDKMLAAVFAEAKNRAAEGGSSIDLDIKQVFVRQKTVEGTVHTYLDITISLDPSSALGDMGGMGSLAEAFLPTEIDVSVTVDVTRGLAEGQREPATLRYNSLSDADTAELLATFGKLGADGLNVDTLTEDVADMVTSLFDSMNEHIELRFVPSADRAESGNAGYEDVDPDAVDVQLSSIYGVLEKNVFTVDGDVIAAADIKAVFDNLYKFDGDNPDGDGNAAALRGETENVADGYGAFKASLNKEYGVREDVPVDSFDDVLKVMTADVTWPISYYQVGATPDGGRPVMTAGELARLFQEKMQDKPMTVLGVSITPAYDGKGAELKVFVELDLQSVFGENADSMPFGRVYATLTVDVDPDATGTYRSTFAINDMTEAEQATLLRMIAMLGVDAFGPEQIASDMGQIVYDQLATLQENMQSVTVTFGDNVILFPDYAEFMAACGVQA